MNNKDLFERTKDIEHFVRCKCRHIYLRPGERLPDEEFDKVTDALVLWCISIGDIVEWDESLWSRRLCHTWVSHIAAATLVEVNDFFKIVDIALCKSFSLEDFRSRIRSHARGPLSYLLAPVRHLIVDFFGFDKVNHYGSLTKLRTFLLFISHLTIKSEITKKESLDKFLTNLDRVQHCESLPSKWAQQWVLRQNLPTPYECNIRHGNGSVAQQRQSGNSLLPLSEADKWAISNTDRLQFYLKRCGVTMMPPWWKVSEKHYARLILVPKGLGEYRVICAEPADNMLIQQSLFTNLDFRRTPLRRAVSLENQSRNSEAACEASCTGHYDCKDLSSASDSVRWAWVEHLLRHRPDWRFALSLCRTRWTMLPDKSLIRNYHFAPMGSACCFPMETLVFCEIVEEGYHLAGLPRNTRYWVYGDDLVVHSDASHIIDTLLERAGFVVNKDKSFYSTDPNFREACGGHWYCGTDVAPIRLSRRFLSIESRDEKSFTKTVSLCNRCFTRLPSVRRYLIRKLRNRFGNSLPFSIDYTDDSCIFTTAWQSPEWRINHQYKDHSYQEIEYKTLKSTSIPADVERAELFAYYKWFLDRDIRSRQADLPAICETEITVPFEGPTIKLQETWSSAYPPAGCRTVRGECGNILLELL